MSRKKTQDAIPRRPGMFRRMASSLLAAGLLLVLLAAGAGLLTMHVAGLPGAREDVVKLEVPRGAGTMAIARRLQERGLVASRWLVLAEVARRRLLGERTVLRAGEYAIPPDASLREIIDLLRSGRAIVHRVTIPEGFSVAQVVERLRDHPMLTGEITEMPEEGSLLPDTYVFRRGESRAVIIDRMRRAQRELLARLWPRRAPDLPLRSPREAVILASIVEKETARPDERRRIAAVFINRLKKGMRLQADPTVIYGLTRGRPLGRPLLRSDLEADHPWNTYRIRGLPPTPIANPGREAIAAVLDPLPTDDLYFVADGRGGHIFASTLKEHNRNVRRWRALRRRLSRADADRADAAGPDRAATRANDRGTGEEPREDGADAARPAGPPSAPPAAAPTAGPPPFVAAATPGSAGGEARSTPSAPPPVAAPATATGEKPREKTGKTMSGKNARKTATGGTTTVPRPRPRPAQLGARGRNGSRRGGAAMAAAAIATGGAGPSVTVPRPRPRPPRPRR